MTPNGTPLYCQLLFIPQIYFNAFSTSVAHLCFLSGNLYSLVLPLTRQSDPARLLLVDPLPQRGLELITIQCILIDGRRGLWRAAGVGALSVTNTLDLATI